MKEEVLNSHRDHLFIALLYKNSFLVQIYLTSKHMCGCGKDHVAICLYVWGPWVCHICMDDFDK